MAKFLVQFLFALGGKEELDTSSDHVLVDENLKWSTFALFFLVSNKLVRFTIHICSLGLECVEEVMLTINLPSL